MRLEETWHRVRIFESLNDALVVLDPASRIVDANTRALELIRTSATAAEISVKMLDVVFPPIAAIEGRNGELDVHVGGEEFAVLLPAVSTEDAVANAESLRKACASIAISTREGPIRVTLSAGVATAAPESVDFAALLDHADGALYDAKNGGRNCVCAVAT